VERTPPVDGTLILPAPRGAAAMSAIRVLLVGLLLASCFVVAAPTASAAACNPHFTGIQEVDSIEYGACNTGLGAINALCSKELGRPCIL